MLEPRPPERRDRVVRQRCGEIDAGDLGAERARDWLDRER
jgi:hypothetical protein